MMTRKQTSVDFFFLNINTEEIPREDRFSSEFPRNRPCRFRDLIIESFSSEYSDGIPRNVGVSSENPLFSSEFPRYIPRKFRGARGFKPKTTFCGLNNTYITFIKCLNQIMKSNFGVLPNNKHFYDCMNENHTT